MGFCTQCGTSLKAEQTLCKACGTQIKQQIISTDNSSKSYITKRKKLIIGIILSSFIVILVTQQWLSSRFDLMKDIEAMDQAIMSADSTAFLKYIEFNENALLNEEKYFKYIKENEWDTVKEQYMQLVDLHKEDSGPIHKVIKGEDQGRLFTLKQNPVLFGLYYTYTWKAIPTTLSVSTPLEQVQITVDIGTISQPLMNNSAIEIATLYPGTYNIEGYGENIFGTFTYQDKVNIAARDINEIEIDFGAHTYPILTNKGDAILFVDDENTGERLEELEFIGPIPKATNLSVHAEWETPKGKVLQSKEIMNTNFDPAGMPFYIEDDS